MCKIAVIDTGIDVNHKIFNNANINCFYVETIGISSYKVTKNCLDKIGHGTAVSGIIISEVKNANLFVFQIFDTELEVEEEKIIFILEYIYSNFDIDIINMSFGCTMCNDKNRMKEICDKLCKKGVILISAFDYEGAISYPAAFNSVIGVDYDITCKTNNEYIYIENSLVNVLGKGVNQKVCWVNNFGYIIAFGSSFSTAYITAHIANNIFRREEDRKNIDDIKKYLCQNAKSIFINKISKETPKVFDYKKISIFPVNKETISILNYYNMLNGKLTKIFDTRYSGKINKNASDFCFKNNNINEKIYNINDIEMFIDEFDTLVIGHTEEITNITKVDYKKILYDICKKHNKNIFFLGEIPKYVENISSKTKIYSPIITHEHVRNDCLHKLKLISSPIVMIAGTSSKQGKFSLQLELRQSLLDKKYKVGQWSTEPQAQLFSIDEVFPSGYNSFLKISEKETVEIINYQLGKIDDLNPDIIITGIQSFSLPYELINSKMYPEYQHSIINAIQPDAIILTINPYDSIDYIERTFKYLESVTQGKIICIVIFPISKKKSWSFYEFQNYKYTKKELTELELKIFEEFNIPTYSMNNISDITNEVINYFSKR